MDGHTIRDREPADLDRCVAVLADVHRLDRYPLNWPAHPVRWLSPDNALHAWVAVTADDVVVGHVAVHRPEPPTGAASVAAASTRVAEVGRLFVAPTARRHNLASRLLGEARRWATERHRSLTLEIVDDPRSAAAIAVYERTGWQHTGTTTAGWTNPEGGPVRLRRYALGLSPESR
ncbi:GNAT family N-acetyltransferase [Plantactinospora sp. GCM10030261]|uniref:GNAT family N-acetyltransferase n=1 Tax=Plantactinospora sp. GCM10030261 TaxID=3273420 RepID=UPI00361C090A